MLSKLLNILSKKSLKDKVIEYDSIQKSIEEINVEINSIILLQEDLNKAFDNEKNPFQKELLYDKLDTLNTEINLSKLKLKREKLEKSASKFLTIEGFDNMKKMFDSKNRYLKVKDSFHKGIISANTYHIFLKSIGVDVIKYSDNLVFNNKGELLIIKRPNIEETFAGYWTIPGGHVDLNEDHLTAAKRELEEETGIQLQLSDTICKVGEYKDDKVEIEYFETFLPETPLLLLDAKEGDGVRWINPKELLCEDIKMPMNMKENIVRILGIDGDVMGQYEELEKGHKYIRKEPDGKGGWNYVYQESEKKEKEVNFKYSLEVNGIDFVTNHSQTYVDENLSPFESKGSFKATIRKTDLVNIAAESEALSGLGITYEDSTKSVCEKLKKKGIYQIEIFKNKMILEMRPVDLSKSILGDIILPKNNNDIQKSIQNFVKLYSEKKINKDTFEKAVKELSGLVKREKLVTKNGKTFRQNFYYRENEEIETPIGGELTPTVKGLEVEKYSDKAILIKGDTYANKDLMQQIKNETGFGVWNSKLKGWLFGLSQLDKVLGLIWSDVKDKDEDKAKAIQNQKNSSLESGDEISLNGEKGKVEEVVSDSDGIKYNVELEDGTKLESVDEKVIEVEPIKDDTKISEVLNKAQAENRAKTEKKLFGIKPIEDIHNYTLAEYLKMNGVDETSINSVLKSFEPKEKSETKKTVSYSSGSKSNKDQTEGLTLKQFIGKLISKHRKAVEDAIERGDEIKPEVLDLYNDLKSSYAQKRQAMSEETKRKISEALTKDKAEEEVKKIIDNLSEKNIDEIKTSFSPIKNELIEKEQSKLAELVLEKEENDKKYYDLYKQAKETENYSKKNELEETARNLNPRRKKLLKLIRNQNNIIEAIKSGGDLRTLKDQTGLEHKNIPDFTKIDTRNIYYDIDTILTEKRPLFIPEIDEDKFRFKGFILDAIRINKDTYMVAVNEHDEEGERITNRATGKLTREGYDNIQAGYVILTLDQLVLTNDYYTTKQKAVYKDAANKRNQAQIDAWDKKSDDQKEKYINYYGGYSNIPAKLQKQFTKDEWGKMSWQEKEKHFKPVKKYNPEKLKTTIEDGNMWTSFHEMHERFVDIDAKRYVKSTGRKLNLGEREIGSYGHPKVFQSWNTFSEMLNWKLNDIKLQREEYTATRKQALETSFGESNTNDTLYSKDGILVKRQNGEQIKPQEVEQIEKAWGSVQKSFGSLKENAKKDGLKLSHSGNTFIYASKAAGVYIPNMKTIAISNKFGEDQFGFTLGHETAHWIDNTLGEKINKRFASDDYESTAGQIAIVFRKNLNKKTDSGYTNSTTECFARALEQYNAIETKGEMAEMAKQGRYFASDDYVSKETYENKIKPLIKQFLDENKEFLKSIDFNIFDETVIENNL